MRDGIRDPLANLFVHAVPRPLYAVPLAPHDRTANPHAGHVAAVGASGEYSDLLGSASRPEILIAERPGGDVERRRVDEDGSGRRDRLTVHIGHGRLEAGVGGTTFGRAERQA